MGAVDAMVVMKQTQTQKSPTGSPCRLLIDGPANGFLDVQRAELQYATGGDVQTLSRRDCGCRQAGRQVEASSGACEKTKDLRSCRFVVRAGTLSQNGGCVRGDSVAADGRACSLSTTKRSWMLLQSAAYNCSHTKTEPENQGIIYPNLLRPKCRKSQLAMSAAWLASVESTLSRPLWLWVRLSLNRSRLGSASGADWFSASRRTSKDQIHFSSTNFPS